jgi:NAD(P)-dependent dehydrogenase (short-subunit alcohol dehydrogenase family)
MARTFPRELLDEDLKSTAERKVFEALRDQLSDEWAVFHSASVIYRDHAEGARDDEGDFVLCHPDQGIVCLEVKGGGIECRHGAFYRLPAGGPRERMPDPFGRALNHRYALQRKIAEVDGWQDDRLFLVHALALPDISVHSLVLGPDAPPQIVADRNDLSDVGAFIDRVLAYHEGSRDRRVAPGPEGEAMLERLLAPTYRIQVPMATLFEEEDRQLVELTGEQAALLNRFGRDRRMVVTGCAGSGKTMLGVERARRLAGAGRKVLFVCFNRALRAHLHDSVKVDGLDFFTFHGLCTRLAHRANVALPKYEDDPPPEYWSEILPLALLEALDTLGGQYDDILVDEAQDLHSDWLDALTGALRDEEEGSIWLFTDDNQRVYDARLEVPREYRPFDLTVNCRNTQAIHNEVMKLYAGAVRPEVRGPAGRQPKLVLTDDEPAAVAVALDELCDRERVRPQDVVVLSAHGRENSAIYGTDAGRWRLTDKRGRKGNCVFFSSIRGFKGLESSVVVLCELGDLDDESRDNQLYVGMSRARNHCVVVAPRAG